MAAKTRVVATNTRLEKAKENGWSKAVNQATDTVTWINKGKQNVVMKNADNADEANDIESAVEGLSISLLRTTAALIDQHLYQTCEAALGPLVNP